MAFIETVYNEECCDLTIMNCRDTHYAVASKFTRIWWYNLKELLLWINKCALISFVALGMKSEGNPLKNGEPTVDLSFTTMLQHTGQLWSRLLSKEQCNNTAASPDLAPADFYLFPRLKSPLKGRGVRDVSDIIKNAKGFHKMDSKECLQHLYSHWQKCIVAQGDYFERNVA